MPLHDFEIAFSKIATTSWYWNPDLPDTVFTTDTVMIPEVFYPGDTIRMDDHFTSAPLVIGYFRSRVKLIIVKYNMGSTFLKKHFFTLGSGTYAILFPGWHGSGRKILRTKAVLS